MCVRASDAFNACGRGVPSDTPVSMSDTPLNEALALVAKGVPVFPCGQDKAPLTEQGHLGATLDPGQVRAWWQQFGGRLYWGVPTGRRTGLGVLDVDIDPAKGVDGRETLRGSGRLPPVTRAHMTPRGGFHLLYSLGPDETCPTDAGRALENGRETGLGVGLDRRGDGGYIIWYPAHGGAVINGEQPAPAPEWLTSPVRTGRDQVRIVSHAEAEQIMRAALNDAANAGSGEHNSSLSRAGFILGQLVAAGLCVEATARELLLEVAASYPEESKTRANADALITKQLRRGAAHPGFEEVNAALQRAFGTPMQWTPKGVLCDFGDLTSRPAPAVWLIRHVLEEAVLAMVFGASGVGKSFVTIDWALSIACGVDWDGHRTKQCPVLYVNGEGHRGFQRRVEAWRVARGLKPDTGMFRTTRKAVAMNRVPDLEALLAEVDKGPRPGIIFIDTYIKATPGADDKNSVDAAAFVTLCMGLIERYGCTVVVVHHSGHGNEGRAKGAVDLKAGMDSEFSVLRVGSKGGRLKVTCTKAKDGEEGVVGVYDLTNVMLPGWFDDEGEQQKSAVLVKVEGVEAAAAVAEGGKVKGFKLFESDRRFLLVMGTPDAATIGAEPVGYAKAREVWDQLSGEGGSKESKRKAWDRALTRAKDREWVTDKDETLVPNLFAIKRDLDKADGGGA